MTLESEQFKVNRTFNYRVYKCTDCNIKFLHYINLKPYTILLKIFLKKKDKMHWEIFYEKQV